MKRIALAVALTLSAAALSACASGPPELLLAAAPTDAASWVPAQRGYLAWNSTQRGWTIAPSGLQYKRVGRARPKAPMPTVSDRVRVHYRGTLINGVEFDSSYARKEPADFPLGRVIRGWTEGVALMHVGETYDFVIPADLAYGQRAMGSDIPANSTLVFRVQLLAINPTTPAG
ncbi:FKBP-type peptidyl-prolyl cis-trans isomerase [Brevundimonas sp.]|jgi:FKBP-type peptidyl-prolyl cis-trans isomerase FkpA|uniref:FKBP-type peptidyl-prolyl cis-trans isomerase n=1 Tax=Brevundimonas sp. TaxID=1871086 RepID=UPI0037833A31